MIFEPASLTSLDPSLLQGLIDEGQVCQLHSSPILPKLAWSRRTLSSYQAGRRCS